MVPTSRTTTRHSNQVLTHAARAKGRGPGESVDVGRGFCTCKFGELCFVNCVPTLVTYIGSIAESTVYTV